MPKCCFGSRSVRSYMERFMALVKQIFFSLEKDRDGIDSHKSRLGLQPDAPTKGISPVMLI